MTRRRPPRAGWLLAIPAAFTAAAPLAAAPLHSPSVVGVVPSPPPIVLTQAGGAQPTLLGTYENWGAYVGNTGGRKVCFALAKPTSAQTTPPNRPRDPSYMFISTRPTENVRNEVSIIIGYGFKPNADATVEIGTNKFSMYTQNDGAWIKNAAEEARMVDAMRKNGELVVKGTSARGTQSTDRYSLKGLGQALDRTAQECK
jgi:invasion associated locus B (IalB) protein